MELLPITAWPAPLPVSFFHSNTAPAYTESVTKLKEYGSVQADNKDGKARITGGCGGITAIVRVEEFKQPSMIRTVMVVCEDGKVKTGLV